MSKPEFLVNEYTDEDGFIRRPGPVVKALCTRQYIAVDDAGNEYYWHADDGILLRGPGRTSRPVPAVVLEGPWRLKEAPWSDARLERKYGPLKEDAPQEGEVDPVLQEQAAVYGFRASVVPQEGVPQKAEQSGDTKLPLDSFMDEHETVRVAEFLPKVGETMGARVWDPEVARLSMRHQPSCFLLDSYGLVCTAENFDPSKGPWRLALRECIPIKDRPPETEQARDTWDQVAKAAHDQIVEKCAQGSPIPGSEDSQEAASEAFKREWEAQLKKEELSEPLPSTMVRECLPQEAVPQEKDRPQETEYRAAYDQRAEKYSQGSPIPGSEEVDPVPQETGQTKTPGSAIDVFLNTSEEAKRAREEKDSFMQSWAEEGERGSHIASPLMARAAVMKGLAESEAAKEEAKDSLMASRIAEKLHALGTNQSLGATDRELEERMRRGIREDLVKAEGEVRALRMRVETLERAFWGLIGIDPAEWSVDDNDDLAGFFARLKNIEKFLESRMDFEPLEEEEKKT